jgi:hypothetical protein
MAILSPPKRGVFHVLYLYSFVMDNRFLGRVFEKVESAKYLAQEALLKLIPVTIFCPST